MSEHPVLLVISDEQSGDIDNRELIWRLNFMRQPTSAMVQEACHVQSEFHFLIFCYRLFISLLR